MKFGKALLVVAGATILLGALVGTASAGRLSTSSHNLRTTFREARFSGGFGTISCTITLEGSFHERTVAKTAGLLTGYITRAGLGGCSAGSATILSEALPWHVRYASFAGTLPSITSIAANIIGISFSVREAVFGITCLTRSTEAQPGRLTFNREAAGALTSASMGGTIGTSCGAEGTIFGTSNSFTVLNSANRITVTLI